MYNSDKPIQRPELDRLGRQPFALKLAKAIDQLGVATEGFVMAITGEWGSGKTSVTKLICRNLLHIEMERASKGCLPWEDKPAPQSIDDLERLALSFEKVETYVEQLEADNKDVVRWERDGRYAELLRLLQSDEEAAKADRYWQLKQQVEKRRSTIVVHFSPWLITGRAEMSSALLSELGRTMGKEPDIKDAFCHVLERLSEFAPVVGAGLGTSLVGNVIRASGGWAGTVASKMLTGETLDEVRLRLRKSLERLDGQKLLLIMDDLDRLTPHEALEIISVVKCLGDLPNVVYLLSYDQSRLVDLLAKAEQVDGSNFLEKIVQYAVPLPPTDEEDLLAILNRDLDEVLVTDFEEEQGRVNSVWFDVLRHYLRTVRDIRRYSNAVRFAWSAQMQYVDRPDLLLLECVRLFDQSIYFYIRDNLNKLIGIEMYVDEGLLKKEIEQLLVSSEEKEAGCQALSMLFPAVASAMEVTIPAEYNKQYPGKRAISDPDFALDYFQLQARNVHWSRDELEPLLEQNPNDTLDIALKRIEKSENEKQSSRLRRLFLSHWADTFGPSRPMTELWLLALCEVAPYFIKAEDVSMGLGGFAEGNEIRLSRVLWRGLESLPGEKKYQLFAVGAEKAQDISILCIACRSFVGDAIEKGSAKKSEILGAEGPRIRDMLLDRVRKLAAKDQIWKQASPGGLLWFWWGTNNASEVRQYISSSIDNNESLICLLGVMQSPVYSSAGDYITVNESSWNKLCDVSYIQARAEELSKKSDNKNYREVVTAFIAALQRGRRF